MTARNLLVLRIDDALFDAEQPQGSRRTLEIDALPLSLDTYSIRDGSGSVSAISRWSTALKIWSRVSSSAVPDLVIADVLFAEDDTTPLEGVAQYGSYPRFIPTGLCHLKPFAALARALERPLGLAIHTRNPAVWEEAWLKEDPHPMAALAAHEIGELAAILGDPIEGTTVNERVSNCWNWLKERARENFDPALYTAMADYRRRLIEATQVNGNAADRPLGMTRALVLPQNWVELAGWAARQAQSGSSARIEPELGIEILFANGHRDHIRLASLFGEVHEIAERRLPARCFGVPEAGTDTAPWELDDSGNPKIGAFLQSIGSLTRIAEEAIRLVVKFPVLRAEDDPLPFNLLDEATDLPHRELTLGLAVLFQVLKWEHARYQAWHSGLEQRGWMPQQLRLVESEEHPSLGEFLSSLARFTRGFSGEPFWRTEVFDTYDHFGPLREKHANSDWARWHFDRLVDAGLLLYDPSGDTYTLLASRRFHLDLLPIPGRLPDGFSEDPGDDLRAALRDTLGFGKKFGPGAKDDNAVGRRLAMAFCGSKEAHDGRQFLDDLLDGSGPPWLLELLRHYLVEVLQWYEPRTWPRWLRST